MASSNLELETIPDANDAVGAILWLIKEGILKEEMNCPECNQKMELKESRKTDDPLSWHCSTQQCIAREQLDEVSCRIGSYFEGEASINLAKWLNIIKGWCDKETKEEVIRVVGLTDETVSMIYRRCRKLCRDILLKLSIKLQSKEICATVKELTWLDVTSGTSTETHLLVVVDFLTHPVVGYMEILPPGKRDPFYYLPIIASVVNPGSRVQIEGDIYFLRAVLRDNIKLFKPQSFAEWNLQSYIAKHKEVIEKIQNPGLNYPQDYLYESMWRERFRSQKFETFVSQLKDLYQPRN